MPNVTTPVMTSEMYNVTTYRFTTSTNSSEGDMDATGLEYDFTWSKDFDYPDLAMPQKTQVTLITIYVMTSFLAICGNIVVIVVLSTGNRSRTDLSRYLINLAVADFLMAIFCIPFTFTKTMLGRWLFGAVMCPLIMFLQVLSVSVSILTNAAVALDRLVAVSFPMKQRITKTRTEIVICTIWSLGVAISIAQLVVGRTKVFYYDGQYHDQCSEQWTRTGYGLAYTVILFLVTYIIPLCLIACAYIIIIRTLWRRRIPGIQNARRDSMQLLSRRKVTKMLVTLVLVFAICWLPIHLFNMVVDFAPWVLESIRTAWHEQLFIGMFYACHWMAMANSFVNPLIYCFMNDSFRADLKYLCRRSPCHPCLAVVADRIFTSRDTSLQRHGSYVIASSKHLVTKRSSSSSSQSRSVGTAKTILSARSLKGSTKKLNDNQDKIEMEVVIAGENCDQSCEVEETETAQNQAGTSL